MKTDWEVELGRRDRQVARNTCLTARCTGSRCGLRRVANDVSERAISNCIARVNGSKGKSCDTYGPTGPYLVTKDEISDVQNLTMFLDVNGKRMQDGSTNTMIFSVNHIVYYLSQFMSLHPGDIISTGTPPGVGLGLKPEKYLKAGDKMELSIQGLGVQKQEVVAG